MSKSLLQLWCAVLVLCGAVTASAGNGQLSGRVSDAVTGESLVRASVYLTVSGKMKGAFADAKGHYLLRAIPEGEYEVHVRYLGYQEKIYKGVKIVADQTTTLNAIMQPVVKTTADVVVEARASRETDAAILAQRKNASQVSDGVSEEEMKRQSDGDAGQVLKRVSGVTLVGEKFVYVRGINERYNTTTLNGVALASTETDKKAFAFDMFPTEFLQNASVVKSFTPDLPGNFAGGLVQLNTIDFPDGYAMKFSVGSSASDNLTWKSGQAISNPVEKGDWIGFDDGSRRAPSILPANRNEMNELIAQSRAYYAGDRSPANTEAVQRWESLGASFNNSVWRRETHTATPNNSINASFSDVFTVAGSDLGVIASLGYNNSMRLSSIERRGISSNREDLFIFSGNDNSQEVALSGLLNAALRLGSTGTISLRNTYSHGAESDLVSLQGVNIAQTRELRLNGDDYVEKSLFSSQLIGEHILSDFGNIQLDWKGGYSVSSRYQPDYRRLRYSRDMNSTDQFIADIPYPGSQSGDGTSAGRFTSDMHDDVWNAGLNLSIPIDKAKVKFGYVNESRSRSFDTRSFTFIQSKIFSRGSVVPDSILAQSPDKIFSAENFGPNGLAISEDSKPSDSYSATEKLNAAYAMVDWTAEVAGVNLRFIVGARVEDQHTDVSTVQNYKSGTNVPDSIVATNLHTTDVLPAINIVYKTTDEMNVRLSATQTLTRPSLREFAPFAFYDFQNLALVQGNPRLTRALIQNFDLRWEYFPHAAEVFSVGLFYKRFKHAIEETVVPAASEIERSFDNASNDAINYGFELEARKNLGFVASWMNCFSAQVNYAFIRSEIDIQQGLKTDTRPLWGQSPYSFNAGLYYVSEGRGTSINLSANVVGRRIVQVAQIGSYAFDDPQVYERPRWQIDLSAMQSITDDLNLKLSVRDLINAPVQWEQGGVIVSSVQRGRSISLSLSYTMK